MERRKKPISKEFRPFKIYLDDLRLVYDVLKELGGSISIKTEEYIVHGIDNLKEVGVEEIHQLEISSDDPCMSLELRPSAAYIYIADDSTYNRGIVSQVEEIFRKCKRRWLNILTSGRFLWSIGFLLGLLLGWGITEAGPWTVVGIAIFALYIFWVFLSVRFENNRHSTIVLRDRKTEVSFYRRNRDQILVAVMAAIVGSLLTLIITLIVVKTGGS